ncbi:BBSome complex member BBS1 isoform X3 [Patagioenas fasciata]|uniref:BBSome complex member BBS1 isoform X3 n=1 Tax=Patagioenas fasciata TaxID=372321 RepID=UPI003A98D1D4
MAAEESASLWLEAHDDPLAGLRCFPACMALVDLHGDGDHKLVAGLPRAGGGAGAAPPPPVLAVVRGAGTITTLNLSEAPVGVGAFGGGSPQGGGGPVLVVAAGPALYVYRNLRPFYKFTLPPRPPDPLELDLWLQAEQEQMDPAMLREMLEDLRDKAEVSLTSRSLRLLALPPTAVGPFVEQHKGRPLQHQALVTCLGSLPRGGPEGTPDCPIVGTEDGDVLVLDPDAFTVLGKSWVPSPPAFVAPRGATGGRWRAAVATRDGTLYGVSRSHSRGRPLLVLGSPPAGLLAQGGALLVATAKGTMTAIGAQGRPLWSLQLPGGVAALAGGSLPGGVTVTLVALDTPRELRLYRGRSLLCTLQTQDVVTGLCFGRYGREDNTLIMTTRGGALSIRMLRRRAGLGGGTHGCSPSPSPAPTPRLPLPPAAASSWRGGRGNGTGPPVQGLGPRLRVTLRLLLPGGGPPAPPPAPLPHLLLLLRCRPSPHRLHPPCLKVPRLFPGLIFSVSSWLEPEGGGAPPGHLELCHTSGCWTRSHPVTWPEAEAAGGVAMGPWASPSPLQELNRRNLSGRAGPPDPHAILGVPPGASPAEIRAAFLARCKEVHPDGDPSDPSRHGRFLLLAEAYGALSQPRPRPPPADPAHRPRPPPAGPAHRAHSPPRSDPNSRYWQQFRPPGRPRGPPPHRLLGLCLLVGALGAAGHALAYRYVAGAHAEFLDERDRELRAVYERARSRAGSREEVLRRLREARERGRGRAEP